MTTATLTPQLVNYAARKSLAVYISAVHRTQNGLPAFPPAHLEAVIRAVQDDALGHTLIVAPPGSAKTNTMIGAAAWWLGHDPTQHVAFISNTAMQGYARSMAVRNTIESPQFCGIFPGVTPAKHNGWSEAEWFLTRNNVSDKDATFTAGGVGSPILGARFNRVILDDIADLENMGSITSQTKILDWLDKVLMSRLVPGGRVILICTRWAENDPAAWAERQGWHTIHLRAVSEAGESYWPQYFPVNKLSCPNNEHHDDADGSPACWTETLPGGRTRSGPCEKRRMGSLSFNLMYQGDVANEENALFKREWWRWYDRPPAKFERGFTCVDTANSDKTTADYSVFATWETQGFDFYLTRLVRKRLTFPDLVQEALAAKVEKPMCPLLIESNPWSRPLLQTLGTLATGVIPFETSNQSKVSRAMPASAFAEAGNCYLPKNHPLIDDFVAEHATFPRAAHDDMVDTTSMAMLKLGAARPMPKNLGAVESTYLNKAPQRERIPSWQRRKGIKPKIVPPVRGGRA